MDLDTDLVQLQGALIKANNACPFKKLEHRGGIITYLFPFNVFYHLL